MRVLGSDLPVTQTLIAANVFVFMFTLVMPEFFVHYFGITPNLVVSRPWTLITNMFIHAGFEHLLFNMISLFFFGLYLERFIGENNFINVYFVGGLVASIAYVLTSFLFGVPPPSVPAVGASGAVFAVVGALAVLRPNTTVYLYFIFPIPLYVLIILYTLYALPAMFDSTATVAHNAHLGGMVVGLLYGMKFKRQIPEHSFVYRRRVSY